MYKIYKLRGIIIQCHSVFHTRINTTQFSKKKRAYLFKQTNESICIRKLPSQNFKKKFHLSNCMCCL